jgi:hypothetical protein
MFNNDKIRLRSTILFQNIIWYDDYAMKKGKKDVKLTQCLTKQHIMKTYWRVEV